MTLLSDIGLVVMGSVEVGGSLLDDASLFDDLADMFVVDSYGDDAIAVARDEFTTVVDAGVGGGPYAAAAATWTMPGNGGSSTSAVWNALYGAWGRF